MTLATKNGSLIVKDGKIAENCGCCGGWYCLSCDCGLASVSLLVTEFVSDNTQLFNPSPNGQYVMTHPSGVQACCQMWVTTIPGGIVVTLYEYPEDGRWRTPPDVFLSGTHITGGIGLSASPCNLRNGEYSSPVLLPNGNYAADPMNPVGFRFKLSIAGVPR
jgi:hypothetical protein